MVKESQGQQTGGSRIAMQRDAALDPNGKYKFCKFGSVNPTQTCTRRGTASCKMRLDRVKQSLLPLDNIIVTYSLSNFVAFGTANQNPTVLRFTAGYKREELSYVVTFMMGYKDTDTQRRASRALLGAPSIATRSKDATRGSWLYYTRSFRRSHVLKEQVVQLN